MKFLVNSIGTVSWSALFNAFWKTRKPQYFLFAEDVVENKVSGCRPLVVKQPSERKANTVYHYFVKVLKRPLRFLLGVWPW